MWPFKKKVFDSIEGEAPVDKHQWQAVLTVYTNGIKFVELTNDLESKDADAFVEFVRWYEDVEVEGDDEPKPASSPYDDFTFINDDCKYPVTASVIRKHISGYYIHKTHR